MTAGEETQVLTILHRKREPAQCFGTIVGERTATAGGASVESNDFLFEAEPQEPYLVMNDIDLTDTAAWQPSGVLQNT